MERKINKNYVRLLRRNRTTIIDLIRLWIEGQIFFKQIFFIMKSPIEVYIGKGDKEELLSTKRGLKMLAKNVFLTYKNKIIIAYEI